MTAIDRQTAYSGVKDVTPQLTFDVGALERFLSARAENFAGPLSVKQFKGGQSNPTYFLETPARNYVLRRKPPGKLLASAHAVDREFKVISALHAQAFPVAEPIMLCEDDSVIGTAFYVMSHVAGRIFWNPTLPDCNPVERAAIFDAMNAALARLHSYDPAAVGLADYGKAEGYVSRQIARWSKQYVASRTRDIPDMERLMAWLPDHAPETMKPAIVHGDYRLDNMILHESEPRVLAVLDWELSTVGDALADFTYHAMTWVMPRSEGGVSMPTLLGLDLDALGIPQLHAYCDAYAKRAGLAEIPHRNFYFAYNLFRLAAILQGILGRVRDGTATNANAANMADAVAPLAAAAWRFANAADA